MIDLQRHHVSNVLVAATKIRDALSTGELSRLEFALAQSDLVFRDENGVYWFLDADAIQWHRFSDGQWKQTRLDPLVLEGPVSRLSERPAIGIEQELLALPQEPQQWTPVTRVEITVQTARVAYERGRISSSQAEQYLQGQYVIDEMGRFWTVGVRSANWHCFENGQWQPAEKAPELDALLRPETEPYQCSTCGHTFAQEDVCPQCGTVAIAEVPRALAQAQAVMLAFFLSGADPLPESVTDPWDPPAGFPQPLIESDVQCPSCSARNPPGSRFCNQCGARLGCPNCGTVNPPHHRFCFHCGVALDG